MNQVEARWKYGRGSNKKERNKIFNAFTTESGGLSAADTQKALKKEAKNEDAKWFYISLHCAHFKPCVIGSGGGGGGGGGSVIFSRDMEKNTRINRACCMFARTHIFLSLFFPPEW